jgi:predicted Zn-dependent protease
VTTIGVETAEGFVAWLESRPASAGAEVVGWRFEIVEGQGLRVGIRGSRLGGAYEGPGSATRLGGVLDLHWSDGPISSVDLDRRGVLHPAGEIDAWRGAAYAARGGLLPPLAGPTALPAVETVDPAIPAALDADPALLLGLLAHLHHDVLRADIKRLDGTLRVSRGWRTVRTSSGFAAAWEETTCTLDLWADEAAQVSFGRRALPTPADQERLVETLARQAPRLRVQDEVPANARGVLFAPPVVEEMLRRLLLPNLAGRAIRDGRSPFTRADLESGGEAGRAVIRSDLDLVVDTTLPLELATAPCSPDGVPAGRVALIVGGRLASPVLDPATARDFDLPPTPVPRGRPAALLVSQAPPLDLDAARALLQDGVVVYDLPGLHTQQARRSRYAVVVPEAQAVAGGVLGGRCAVRLAGNLMDHLTQPTTRLVRMSGELGIGLLVLPGVELLPA